MWKAFIIKAINDGRKKSKKSTENGKISYAHYGEDGCISKSNQNVQMQFPWKYSNDISSHTLKNEP
jgi:hypothetical protein